MFLFNTYLKGDHSSHHSFNIRKAEATYHQLYGGTICVGYDVLADEYEHMLCCQSTCVSVSHDSSFSFHPVSFLTKGTKYLSKYSFKLLANNKFIVLPLKP